MQSHIQKRPSPLCLLLACALLLVGLSGRAELKLPAIFGDNMVLQREMRVPIWGWADPGAEVTVSFAGQSKTGRATADGRWLVRLGKLKARCAPQTLVITANGQGSQPAGVSRTFTNILVGEVWLCSGQSNMEKPIGNQPGQRPCFNAEAELAVAKYPGIRLFKIERTPAAVAQTDFQKYQGWQDCSSNSLDSVHFSAVAYFFGREIHTNLNVPVGLIDSSWGGTRIEPWTPAVGFAKVAALAKLAEATTVTNKVFQRNPMVLYNGMIAPMAGFSIRGALWYQGEANHTERDYADKMAALVGGWRQVWGEGEFPFYFVQIAPFRYIQGTKYQEDADPLPRFWAQQSRAARQIKNTGMAVTTDLVDDLNDIHPRDKVSVGHRLALLALDRTYKRGVVSSGPSFRKATFRGGKAILYFDHTEGGLVSRGGQPLTWFSIAGSDRKFVPAEVRIVGDAVEVSAAEVEKPVTVRFAWNQTAQPNLYNGAGLPAEPFCTDELRR